MNPSAQGLRSISAGRGAAPLRLLFLASCAPYGISNVLSEQALSLSELVGEQLLCVAGDTEQFPGTREQLLRARVPLRVIPGLDAHASADRLVTALAEAITSFAPNVVQVHSNWQLFLVHRARRLCRNPFRLCYWMHGYRHNHPVKSQIARAAMTAALAAWADLVIVTSGPVQRKFRLLGRRLRLLPQGVERRFFDPALPGPNLASLPRRIVFAGQFRPGKNQEWLIDALARYRAITADHSVHLILPGAGERLDACRRLARKLGVAHAVEFPGHLDRQGVLEAYLAAQAAVVPVNSETFGYCIAEPLVLGRIVISRPVGCAAELIRHGVNGYLFHTRQELLERLFELLPRLAQCGEVSGNARTTGARLQWGRINGHYLEVLDGRE